MAIKIPIRSPWVRHDDPNTDIFGPTIILEHNDGFMTMNVDEVSHVEVPDSRNMVVHFKNNDEFTLYDISEHDYNEILCWVTVNKLKA